MSALEAARGRARREYAESREVWLARALVFVGACLVWAAVVLYALVSWLGVPAALRTSVTLDMYPVALSRLVLDPLNPFSLTVLGLGVLTVLVGEGVIAIGAQLRSRWA